MTAYQPNLANKMTFFQMYYLVIVVGTRPRNCGCWPIREKYIPDNIRYSLIRGIAVNHTTNILAVDNLVENSLAEKWCSKNVWWNLFVSAIGWLFTLAKAEVVRPPRLEGCELSQFVMQNGEKTETRASNIHALAGTVRSGTIFCASQSWINQLINSRYQASFSMGRKLKPLAD